VSEVGLTDKVQPVGPVTVSATVPLNVLSDFIVTVEVPVAPRLIVREDGDAEIEKSGVTGAGTVTVTVAEWFSEPLVPCTVRVYVPAVVPVGTVMDSVDVADPPDATVSEVGLTDRVQPVGPETASETVPLKVLSDFTVMVEVPPVPALMVKADGDAEIEKSGVVTREKLVVRGLPKPVTRS
jgi:hypothetical protein